MCMMRDCILAAPCAVGAEKSSPLHCLQQLKREGTSAMLYSSSRKAPLLLLFCCR